MFVVSGYKNRVYHVLYEPGDRVQATDPDLLAGHIGTVIDQVNEGLGWQTVHVQIDDSNQYPNPVAILGWKLEPIEHTKAALPEAIRKWKQSLIAKMIGA